jgi:hypothetical protein
MMHIESDCLSIDEIMRSRQETPNGEPVPENYPTLGTWKGTPFRVYLHEPTDSLKPARWVLEVAGKRYPLAQSSIWEESVGSDFGLSWREKSTWRVRSADGRWVPSLQSLGDDEITID